MIELKNVSRTGRKQESLLNDISLTIHASEQLAIAGPSGSGKSLLLRTIAMLDPLSSGELYFCGEAVPAAGIPRYRSTVVYLHQQPSLLDGTVLANLQHPFGFQIHRHRTFDANTATELFTQMGRDAAILQRHSSHLSGGERQLVSLVRAMLLQPRVLLLDEATAALDETTALQVEEVISRWVNAAAAGGRESRAVVWVTHSEMQRNRVASRVVQIREGSLL